MRAVRDAVCDDPILGGVAALERQRLGEAANGFRFLLVVQPEGDGWHDDKRDASVVSLAAPREADAVDKLEDHALALSGRQGDRQRAPCRRGKGGTNRSALARTPIGSSTNGRKKRVAFRVFGVESPPDGLCRNVVVDPASIGVRKPVRTPRKSFDPPAGLGVQGCATDQAPLVEA
ncbi:hypothetical protein D3C86_1584920 [compost metagenome]